MADAPADNDGKSCWKKTQSFVAVFWKSLVTVGWPLLTLPFLISYWQYKQVRCAYVVCTMAVYWVTSCLPMAVASLLPIALYPAFDVMSTEETVKCYINDTIFMFIGGLVLALAIEHSNLHMRIALRTMTIVGCSHKRLMGGLLIVTTFVSMWISNTAATAMMLPIVFAVLTELEKEGVGKVFVETVIDGETVSEASTVTRGYLMSAAYAASFGGTATFVGTGTNLAVRGLFEAKFPKHSLSFFGWMMMAMPQAYLNAFLTWVYIQVSYFGMFRPNSKAAKESRIGPEGEAVAKRVMAEKYTALGKMSFHEWTVSILFTACVLLWLTRDPGFVDGWYKVIKRANNETFFDSSHKQGKAYISDSTPVMLITILMFIIPKDLKFLHACSKDANKRPVKASEGVITWDLLQKKIPWGMMFLLGGGFAISRGGQVSKLSSTIGRSLNTLDVFPPFMMLCIICFFIGLITEFTSNVGVANLTIPVIMEMCEHIKINPMYLVMPATIMCSYSFRLPVGTPPNALIALHGKIQTKYLMAGGCFPSIYSLIVVIITFSTWGVWVYDISLDRTLPDWANSNNSKSLSAYHLS